MPCLKFPGTTDVQTLQREPAGWAIVTLSNTVDSVGREMQLVQSGQRSILCYAQMLWQFGHWKLGVPAVVSYIPSVVAEPGVLKAVAAHLGVFVVDRVDEEEDDRDGNYSDGHKSCYQRQVVLCK